MNELNEVKGFSERNISQLLTFYKEYLIVSISPLSVAKLEENSFRQPIVVQLNDQPILQPSVAKFNLLTLLERLTISPRQITQYND
jgi:hypothetical protein